MATQRTDLLQIGKGTLTEPGRASQVFASTIQMGQWSAGLTYLVDNCVEYSGKIYRSLVNANIGNTPSSSPSSWEIALNTVKDGDVALVVNGGSSDMMQRVAGAWTSLSGQPATVTLVDGQVSPVTCIAMSASSFHQGLLTYTIRRGSGFGRQRRGELRFVQDGSGSLNYSHEIDEIGLDVNTIFTFSVSGGFVIVQYTSGAEGTALELKWAVKGWA